MLFLLGQSNVGRAALLSRNPRVLENSGLRAIVDIHYYTSLNAACLMSYCILTEVECLCVSPCVDLIRRGFGIPSKSSWDGNTEYIYGVTTEPVFLYYRITNEAGYIKPINSILHLSLRVEPFIQYTVNVIDMIFEPTCSHHIPEL